MLYIALDFYAGTPMTLLALDPTYPELPTIPSDIDQFKATLQEALGELKKLPLEALFSEVLGMLKRANTFLETPEIKQTLVSLHEVASAAERLLQNADGQVSPLGTKLRGAADAARVTLEMARTVLAGADAVIHNDLAHTLKALEEAVRSIRALADMLDRHPEALLRGKSP